LCWASLTATHIIKRGWKMVRVNCKGCKNKEKEMCDISDRIVDCQLWEGRKGMKKYI